MLGLTTSVKREKHCITDKTVSVFQRSHPHCKYPLVHLKSVTHVVVSVFIRFNKERNNRLEITTVVFFA